MTTWLFDLGNSRLKCAPLLGCDGIGEVITIAHQDNSLEAEWARRLPDRFDSAFVASVAPVALRVTLLETLIEHCSRVTLANSQARFGDAASSAVTLAYSQPESFGVDRFLSLIAARARSAQPWLIVGAGTALTIDLLDSQGLHRGGRIAASPWLMRQALHARAAQLPESGGHYIAFADNTEDALASGCDGAAIALIEHSLHQAAVVLDSTPQLLLHGGDAQRLAQHFSDSVVAPALVLEGLARWASVEDRSASAVSS